MDGKKKIIKQIIDLMAKLKISAYRLAKDTGISEAGIGKILNGKSKSPSNRNLDLLLNSLLNYEDELNFEKQKQKLEERASNLRTSSLIPISDVNLSESRISRDEFLAIIRENRELLKEISHLKDIIIKMQAEQLAFKSLDPKPTRKNASELIKK